MSSLQNSGNVIQMPENNFGKKNGSYIVIFLYKYIVLFYKCIQLYIKAPFGTDSWPTPESFFFLLHLPNASDLLRSYEEAPEFLLRQGRRESRS